MEVLRNITRNSKGGDTSPPYKRHPWPTRPPLTGPLFNTQSRRHIEHLTNLGPRPIGEFLLQLVGTSDDARSSLVILLEQYQRLDADVVKALGGDRWPETIFPVETA